MQVIRNCGRDCRLTSDIVFSFRVLEHIPRRDLVELLDQIGEVLLAGVGKLSLL